MSTRVDVTLLPTLQAYGAFDISACFNCGNCTAICPLSTEGSTFPRRLIRYAQVGMRDELLASKEIWSCYACSECSVTCPRQAEPSGFMAATRRYAIASYDRTHLARTIYLHPVLGTILALALAAFFALFMYASHGPQDSATLAIFEFIPAALIHDIGVVVMILVFVAGLVGISTMARRIAKREGVRWRSLIAGRTAVRRTMSAAWDAVAVESLGQRRYRQDCASDEDPVVWYRSRWFLHAAAMWGFLGLLGATILDYGLDILGIKETGTPVPVWYPVRLLGTLAGLLLVYGVTMIIIDHARRADRSMSSSTNADWMLLTLLWVTGVTGFALELALYLPEPPAWGYWMFLFHVAVAMELVLLAPFMKLAHAVYRPVALFFVALARTPVAAESGSGADGS